MQICRQDSASFEILTVTYAKAASLKEDERDVLHKELLFLKLIFYGLR